MRRGALAKALEGRPVTSGSCHARPPTATGRRSGAPDVRMAHGHTPAAGLGGRDQVGTQSQHR